MSIRARSLVATTVLVGLLWLALVGVVWIWGATEAATFELAEASRAVNRVNAILAHEGASLDAMAKDWARWDATHDFVAGTNPAFAAENLTAPSLAALDVDFMALYDLQGEPVAGAWLEDDRITALPATLASALANSAAICGSPAGTPASGLLDTGEDLFSLAAQAITPSDGAGSANGYLVVGRKIDGGEVSALAKIATIPLTLHGTKGPGTPAAIKAIASHPETSALHTTNVSNNTVVTMTSIEDVDGEPAIVLQTRQKRIATAFAGDILRKLTAILMLFSVGLIASVAILNDRLVLGRLATLSQGLLAIGQSRDPSARLTVEGADEITGVARNVNSMLTELEGSQTDLSYLATHDSLTRLFNRRRFELELDSELANGSSGAVMWCDIDHFKELNDSLGHAAGDELLVQFTQMLQDGVRDGHVTARLGGDEFGIIMPGATPEEAMRWAGQLLADLSAKVFEIKQHEIRMSSSIGVVWYPEHGTSRDDLLTRADLAMYHSKAQGRNHVSAYSSDDEWRTEMSERVALSEQTARAIRDGRMQMIAQPIVEVATGEVASYELLLRLIDDNGAVIMPADVIPTAERLGIIRDIDRWVVKTGVAMLAREQIAGRRTNININLSGSAFSDPGILRYIHEEIIRSTADPTMLTIEITETSAITDMAFAREFIEKLRAFGCRFALDDFGSGASSLYYLKHLPIDCVKIDGSLIRDLVPGSLDLHFVRAIVEMCKGLEIVTVAEFVEDEFLYAIVSELGVDRAQGFGIGRPAPLSHYTASENPSWIVADAPPQADR